MLFSVGDADRRVSESNSAARMLCELSVELAPLKDTESRTSKICTMETKICLISCGLLVSHVDSFCYISINGISGLSMPFEILAV